MSFFESFYILKFQFLNIKTLKFNIILLIYLPNDAQKIPKMFNQNFKLYAFT